MTRPVHAVLLSVLCANAAFAQQNQAALFGTVRSSDGTPIQRGSILAGRRFALTDSLGHFRLDSLDAGRTRVLARAMGATQRDTTIALSGGASVQWDVVLQRDKIFAGFERAAAENQTAGRIDSVALGLLTPHPERALPLGAFGSRLFAKIATTRGADSNTVLSPVSVGLALSLVRMGARDETANAIDSVLGMSLDRSAVEQRGATMIDDLSRRTDVILSTSNALWIDSTVVAREGFLASTARWNTKTSTLTLSSQRAVDVINRWADSVTHKKISTILDEPLPEETKLLVTNAVYFKGKWLEPFEKTATRPGDFALTSGRRITVPRMQRRGSLGYGRVADFQIVRLPYRTGKVAMYVILPDSGVAFDAVMRRVASSNWLPATSLTRQDVNIVLPRFRADLTVDLAEPLGALGARIAFVCGRADFSAMAVSRATGERIPLCIDRATQKVFVEVDEEGTEAAAITAFSAIATSASSGPIEFIVNRPFLFVLRDETTGTDLFVGRIARP